MPKRNARGNELLQYVWAYHRIADRLGQRRSGKFTTALQHLAQAAIPDAAPKSDLDCGYLPDADAVWVRRSALPKLTHNVVAAPGKNLFHPDKNIITKLKAL